MSCFHSTVADVDFIHQLRVRLAYFMLRAFNENVFYRLFLFSVLAWGMTRIWPGPAGRPTSVAMWSAMVVAQMVNIGLNVCLFDPPSSVASIVYDGLRYIVPGVCWGLALLAVRLRHCRGSLRHLSHILAAAARPLI